MLSLLKDAASALAWFVTESILKTLEMVLICLIPLFATVRIIQTQQKTKYDACLSFWILLAVITFLEYITFFTYSQYTIYRVFRLLLSVMVHQMGEFSLWLTVVMTKAKPLMDGYRDPITRYMQMADAQIGGLGEKATNKFGELFGNGIQSVRTSASKMIATNFGLITATVMERLSAASSAVQSQDPSVGEEGDEVEGSEEKEFEVVKGAEAKKVD